MKRNLEKYREIDAGTPMKVELEFHEEVKLRNIGHRGPLRETTDGWNRN